MANQVLSRPMFKPSPNQVAPTVSGIGAMTTPDQNAQALKNMFAPQPAYKRGGEVINGVAHFVDGGLNKAGPPGPGDMPVFQPGGYDLNEPLSVPPVTGEPEAPTPERYVPKTPIMRSLYGAVEATPERQAAFDKVQKEKEAAALTAAAKAENRVPTIFEEVTDEQRATAMRAQQEAVNQALQKAGIETLRSTPAQSSSDATMKAMQSAYSNANPAGLSSPAMGGTPIASAATPPPALPPLDNGQELQLQSIRARREASDKQREENKNLALLSAGLGMMAGTNRNAFANIGTGGQQGIATFAGLEKTRREDEATRRREDILTAQMDQQMKITKMQLAQDPEQVRVYKALGGGDLVKGFQLVSSDKILEAAVKLSADFTADPTKRANAVNFINQRIQESSGARPGAAGGLPPGSTVRSATDFVAAGK
jgi:hypothetical protein